MTSLVRKIMSEAGFLSYGHHSMTLLVRALKKPDVVTSGTLAEEIRLVDEQTKPLREELQKIIQETCQNKKDLKLDTLEVAIDKTKTPLPDLVALLKKLYGDYTDGKLPRGWAATTMFHSDTSALAAEGATILAAYSRLAGAHDQIMQESAIPAYYLPAREQHP
jgi:hypothetical protein